MIGMDRLTNEALERIVAGGAWVTEGEAVLMARELLAHRRASQAAPAPSDGLREALRPFASLIEVSGWSELPDDTSILGQGPDHDRRQVTAGDFKRALAALSASPAQEGGRT